MAIRPTAITASGIEVTHDERGGHSGTIQWADVDFGRQRDGTPHQSYLTLPCPACGKTPVNPDGTGGEWISYSVHPVSGGADREWVRELFARFYMRRAAALGLDAATLAAARALVAKRADELEGRAAVGAVGAAKASP